MENVVNDNKLVNYFMRCICFCLETEITQTHYYDSQQTDTYQARQYARFKIDMSMLALFTEDGDCKDLSLLYQFPTVSVTTSKCNFAMVDAVTFSSKINSNDRGITL